MGEMRDSDWSRPNLLRSDWLPIHVAIMTTSGATGNMIRHFTAKHLGRQIISSAQSVQQADGSSQLQVDGEIRTSFTRDNTDFTFEELVVVDLDV